MNDLVEMRRKARIISRGLQVQVCLDSARKTIEYMVKNGVGFMDVPFPLVDLDSEVGRIRCYAANIRLFSKYSERRLEYIKRLIRSA